MIRKYENILNLRNASAVHIDDDISSLSAIALDEDFYAFMKEGRMRSEGGRDDRS